MKRAFIAACLLVVAACGAKQQQEASERDRVTVAIDALQKIPAEDVSARTAAAEALRKMDVKNPSAIRARDACADAYRSLADSTRLAAEASAGLAPSSHVDPAQILQTAKEAIAAEEASEEEMASCADARAALRLGR